MALLGFAAFLVVCGCACTVMAVRLRQGHAEGLRRRAQVYALWPGAGRSVPYALFPIAAGCFLTAASMAASVAGLRGPVLSAGYLILLLATLVCLIVFMVAKPRWLDPHPPEPWGAPGSGTPEQAEVLAGLDPQDVPPRPIAQMSSRELAEWARDDPEKLRRLLRRYDGR
jgi:hypothetical protein